MFPRCNRLYFGMLRRYKATASEYRRCNDYRYSDAARQQRRSIDAATELVLRCCVYWPNRLGWRQKVLQPPSMFILLSWWCPLGHGKRHLPAKQIFSAVRLTPILTYLSSRWTVPLSTQEWKLLYLGFDFEFCIVSLLVMLKYVGFFYIMYDPFIFPTKSFPKIRSINCDRDGFMCWSWAKMSQFILLSLRLSGIEFSLVSD